MANTNLNKWYQEESSKINNASDKLVEIQKQMDVAIDNDDFEALTKLNEEFKKLSKELM